ncbi:MAG: ABC transporter permease [Bacteroidota bacterium]
MSSVQPPKLANKILALFCDELLLEDLLGDMEEEFHRNVKKFGVTKAKLKYYSESLSLIFSSSVKRRKRAVSIHPFSKNSNTIGMLKNYIIVAVRSLARNKFFTIINVLGLAFGMSVTILYLGFMTSLLKFDKFHEGYDNIYRVVSTVDRKTRVYDLASAPPEILDVLKDQYSLSGKMVKLNDWISGDADYENKVLPVHGFYTEPSFFDIFSFQLLEGNAKRALTQPFQVIITESGAAKLFGSEDPIGKVISFGEKGDYTVSGLMADPPKNSHLTFEVLASYSSTTSLERDEKIGRITGEWTNFQDNYSYIQLDHSNASAVQAALNQIAASTYVDKDDVKASFQLQPMSEIVMGWKNYNDDIGPYFGGPPVIGFGALTLLILLPACFNYSNISISRAMKRAKEIGIRKVVGGYKKQIWYQFIVETVIIALLALIGSVSIFFLIKDSWLDMLAGGNTVDFNFDLTMALLFIVFAIITGFLAGIIPATYFSKIKPITALKSTSSIKLFGKTSFKKVLIVFQFTISLFFIIGVLVQLKQTRYSINFDMGFDKENLLDVELYNVDPVIVKNEFQRHADVNKVSLSSEIIGAYTLPRRWIYLTDRDDSLRMSQMSIDENYLSNLGLELIAGRNFDAKTTYKDGHILVNETFCKNLGLEDPRDAVGQPVKISNLIDVTIIGVVKDFNYDLLRTPIRNCVFRYDPSEFKYANLKVNTSDHFTLFSDLENTWKEIEPEHKFKARFFDDELEEAFEASSQLIKIYAFMGLMAIIVGCLGLLGMVVYSTETRAKEVGVRKVMGASVSQIIYLLSKEYALLMFIASFIAIPLSYFAFNFLLAIEQHYSVTVGILEVIMGLGTLLVIGALTMASQTYQAANANPVDTLQTE